MAHLRCASSVASGACSAVGVVDATEIPISPADRPAHSSAVSFTGRLSNAGRRALAHVVSSESGPESETRHNRRRFGPCGPFPPITDACLRAVLGGCVLGLQGRSDKILLANRIANPSYGPSLARRRSGNVRPLLNASFTSSSRKYDQWFHAMSPPSWRRVNVLTMLTRRAGQLPT